MAAVADPAVLPKPRPTGTSGEAGTFYFDREFARNAVKLLPGEFFVAREDILLSTVLGSCVSACIWDPGAKIGGMNHFMLPGDGGPDPSQLINAASGRYGVFAMEQLINEIIKRGGRKPSLEAKVFGGGSVLRNFSTLNVGDRNAEFAMDFLRTEGIRVTSQDLLDIHPRRVAFFPVTGRALCKKLMQAEASLVSEEQKYKASLSSRSVSGDVELF